MRKMLIFGVVAIVVLGLLGPADAKKKKKKPPAPVPIELQFFLRAPESCSAEIFLSLTDGEDADCVYGDTSLNPVYGTTGLVDPVLHYNAVDGVPLKLDPSRPVTASISTRGWNSTGVGISDWTFTLVATIAGEEKEIGRFETSQTTGPAETPVLEFELELDPAATAGAVVDALRLDVYIEGVMVAGRGIEHDEPISLIKVPAFQ